MKWKRQKRTELELGAKRNKKGLKFKKKKNDSLFLLSTSGFALKDTCLYQHFPLSDTY